MKPITHQAESTLDVYQNGSYTTCTNSSGATPITIATDTAIFAVTSMAEARRLADRILRAVSGSPVELGAGVQRAVTVSIGIATLTPGTSDSDLKALADQLLAEADAALYRAKAAGRNCVDFRP